MLVSPRFVDRSPAKVVTALLDEGDYLCSERTMYRVLAASQAVRERRNQRKHPQYTRPELLATGPNQVWSWDVTKLLGPKKWMYFYLYVLLDIYSRYVVGWMVADRENSALAGRLIEQTCHKQGIQPQMPTAHCRAFFPLVQRRASPRRHRYAHPWRHPPWTSRGRAGTTPAHAALRLGRSP